MFKSVAVILIAGITLLTAFQVMGTSKEEEATPVNPLVPGVASFIVPGTGQLLIGHSDEALLHSLIDIGVIAAGCSAALVFPTPLLVWEITAIARLSWSAYSALDAYSSARELNRYQAALTQLISYMVSRD